MQIQPEVARLQKELLDHLAVRREGDKDFVDKLGECDAAKFLQVAQHSLVSVRMRVQESAKVVAQVAVVLQPACEGLSHLPRADDEGTRLPLAFLRAAQDEHAFYIPPSGKRENVGHARENYNDPRNLLISGGKDEEHQKGGGDSDGLGDANGFRQGGQLARGSIEALADASQENKRAVKNQETRIGLHGDVANQLSRCYDSVPTVREAKT